MKKSAPPKSKSVERTPQVQKKRSSSKVNVKYEIVKTNIVGKTEEK
jgi:hypothetical protein